MNEIKKDEKIDTIIEIIIFQHFHDFLFIDQYFIDQTS